MRIYHLDCHFMDEVRAHLMAEHGFTLQCELGDRTMKEMDSQTKLSLKLQAYQYLKTKILNCEYRPNEFLNEQKLCAEMGNISRTPMRDALGRLEQEGLITILPKKGLMVSGITEEDVHSMFEMRLLVEPYALRTYGSGIPREQLETFAELMHHPDSINDFCSFKNSLGRYSQFRILVLRYWYACSFRLGLVCDSISFMFCTTPIPFSLAKEKVLLL